MTEFEESYPYIDTEQIDNSYGIVVTQFVGGAQTPVRVDSILLASSDTVDQDVQFWVNFTGTPQTCIGTIKVPAGAGFVSTVPVVQAIATLFPGREFFIATDKFGLGVGPLVAITSGKMLWVTTTGGFI
jgi:hypothetical protein